MTSDVAYGPQTTEAFGIVDQRPSEVMSALGIVQLGNPILTRATRPFVLPDEQDEVLRILDRLTAVADAVGRVHNFTTGAMGLAAPQINEPRSIAVFRAAGQPQLVLVNPRVVEVGPPSEQEWEETSEGCLSFFDFRCYLRRPRTAVISYLTVTGEPVTVRFDKGRLARDVLHEVDHLNGILCLDRLEPGTPTISVV
ncbi:peptide deformylase [Dactylosporangium roseum]|uniref:Peptide deformylase n=1 Tax=Dactylosporangium roseum TaxID=47989 RepID=A0ABY5Z3T6_9ACTN|nr:peptide deformylase [Dactylosporangium roseum]UWZ36482.1 peptide deformylase [Dactylosporangium roseum]